MRQVGPQLRRHAERSARARRTQGWVAANVAHRVELPPARRSEDIRYLEVEHVRALVAAARPGPYEAADRALYLTAAMTGWGRAS